MPLPLTSLTSPKISFQWNPTADMAFKTIKEHIDSAPVLIQPELSKQFIIEVDASDPEVGAVFAQQLGDKLQPFFSCCLTPAERNYVVGDQELLAIKEWRQWLEVATHPFII